MPEKILITGGAGFVGSHLAAFCFTPEHRGIAPHHTSAPQDIGEYADFCVRMVERYAPCEVESRIETAVLV